MSSAPASTASPGWGARRSPDAVLPWSRRRVSFLLGSENYRIIPGDVESNELICTHVSTNIDRTGFAQDWNIFFPLDRLRELVREGVVGSAADFHYSFMGATEPEKLEKSARELAALLRRDHVSGVLLVPV